MIAHLSPRAGSCLHLVESLAALTCLLRAAQLLSLPKSNFRTLLLQQEIPLLAKSLRLLDIPPTSPGTNRRFVLTIASLSLFSASALLLAVLLGRNPLHALNLLLLCRILGHLVGRITLDASDQFSLLCLLPCAAAEWIHTDTAYTIALIFIAGQSALAYGTAGFLKLSRYAGWFDGSNLLYLLSTQSFGNPRLYQLFTRYPGLARYAGKSLVLGECVLALACLLPPNLCLTLLACGVVLHFGIARVMGLNGYLWAFTSAYPATWFVSTQLHR